MNLIKVFGMGICFLIGMCMFTVSKAFVMYRATVIVSVLGLASKGTNKTYTEATHMTSN